MLLIYVVTNILHTNVTLSVINVERTNVACMGSKTTMTIPLTTWLWTKRDAFVCINNIATSSILWPCSKKLLLSRRLVGCKYDGCRVSVFISLTLGVFQCGSSFFLHYDSVSIQTRFMQLPSIWSLWMCQRIFNLNLFFIPCFPNCLR